MQIISEKNGSRNSSDDLKITQFTKRGDMLIIHYLDEQHPERKGSLRLKPEEYRDLAGVLYPRCNGCEQYRFTSKLYEGFCPECRGLDNENEGLAECSECGLEYEKAELETHGMCNLCHYHASM